MNNSRDYINGFCLNCANRLNDKDLCNITKRIDGNFNCVNYRRTKQISNGNKKINEYVRTDKGFIKYISDEMDLEIIRNTEKIYFGRIKKQSKNIKGLIEKRRYY